MYHMYNICNNLDIYCRCYPNMGNFRNGRMCHHQALQVVMSQVDVNPGTQGLRQ